MGNTKIDAMARPAQIYRSIIADNAQQFSRPTSPRLAAAWTHRTPHSAHVAHLVDAQASGSVHVREIDEHKAAFRCALAPRDAIIFCNFSRTKENFGAGEGIRTLDPDLGKVVLYP